MTVQAFVQAHRADILPAAAKHGARNVRLFWSVARGEADDKSDIDLLVDFEPGRSLMDQAALIIELESLLGRKVDVASERGLVKRVRENVLREAVSLHGQA
jgi:predicted nucleotidyltransferase